MTFVTLLYSVCEKTHWESERQGVYGSRRAECSRLGLVFAENPRPTSKDSLAKVRGIPNLGSHAKTIRSAINPGQNSHRKGPSASEEQRWRACDSRGYE